MAGGTGMRLPEGGDLALGWAPFGDSSGQLRPTESGMSEDGDIPVAHPHRPQPGPLWPRRWRRDHMEVAEGSRQGTLCGGVWRGAGGDLLQRDLPQVRSCSATAVRAPRGLCEVPVALGLPSWMKPVVLLFH